MLNYLFKYIPFVFAVTVSFTLNAQFVDGFDKREARDMIAICNSFTFIKVLNSDKKIIPQGYEKVYESVDIGLDNRWQLWRNDKFAVINLRGSTSKQISWLANFYSAMIPANGEIILPGNESFKYKLSNNSKSNVHSGWTLAMAFIAKDIVQHIKMLNYEGNYHFIIIGHSQGAAIAQLLRAYLENCNSDIVSDKNRFKTYVFASPMVGNRIFVKDYYDRYLGTNFVVNNPEDPVIRTPYTIDKNKMINPDDINIVLDTTKSVFKALAYRAIGKMMFNNPDSAYIERAGFNVHEQIIAKVGPVTMPEYQLDMSYTPDPDPIYIGPFSENRYINKEAYSKFEFEAEKLFYQHKSYLYFLEILRLYFPDEFKKW